MLPGSIVGYTDKLSDDKGGALRSGSGGEMRIPFALAEFSRILELDWDSASWRCI
jgi:hypothetical protein